MKTQSKGFNIFLGIVMVILGLVMLGSQFYSSMITIYFLGWVLLIGGVTEFFYGFFSGGIGRAFFFFILGILSAIIGLILISNPLTSLTTVTLFMGFYFLASGIYKAISSLIQRYDNWGWVFSGGIVTFILGMMILNNWPASGLVVIGLFLGIEFMINGFLLMASPVESENEAQWSSSQYAGAKGGKAKKDDDNME